MNLWDIRHFKRNFGPPLLDYLDSGPLKIGDYKSGPKWEHKSRFNLHREKINLFSFSKKIKKSKQKFYL